MTNFRRSHLNARSESGQSLVEFALVLPILCVLLFGIVQVGIAYKDYVTVTDAVRAGARKGAVSRNLGSGPAASATESQVRSSASDLDQSKLAVTVTSGWGPGDDLQVKASYPYDINLLGFVVASGKFSSTTTERVE
jgi:Flp pilus assembly protein TadG